MGTEQGALRRSIIWYAGLMFVGTIVFIGAPETARWWWGIPQLSDWATETTIRPLPTPPSGVAPGSNIAAPKIILKNSYVGKIGQDIIHNPPDNVARHMKRRHTLEAVAEQRDHGEVVADRQLTAMEDRPGGDGELAAATGALPTHRRLGQRVDLENAAVGTERLAAVRTEADPLEDAERFLVRQPQNLSDAQRASGRR
jgi:hypothetical protein